MSRPAGQKQFEFERLRRLLFSAESERLSAVENLVVALDARVGAPERLEKATAEILVEAFRAAEIARHQELARAIAPLVAAAIRNEIANSRDSMVEALYPITGRLVSAAVANAIKNLAADINKTLDPSNVTRHWRLRLKALTKGKSLQEVALAESRRPVLRRLLLLERGSGRPIATWSRDADAETSELVSGMIAAITEFASSIYGAQDGELRTLDLGGSSVLLRATPVYLVAAEIEGAQTSADEKAFDAAVLSISAAADRTPEKAREILQKQAAILLPATSEKAPTSSKPLLGLAVALAFLGVWAGWGPMTRKLLENRINSVFQNAIRDNPGLSAWPLRMEVDHSAQRVVILGLLPSHDEAGALARAVAKQAVPYAVVENVATLAGFDSTARAIAKVDGEITAMSDRLTQIQAFQATRLEQDQQREENQKQDLERAARAQADMSAQLDATRAELEQVQRKLAPDARARAEKLFSRTAIFFLRETQFADAQKTEEKLIEVAKAIKEASSAQIFVVGQADWSGAHDENVKLAIRRAELVRRLLINAGAPAENIQVSAHFEAPPPNKNMARDYRARRVTFQLGYENEPSP